LEIENQTDSDLKNKTTISEVGLNNAEFLLQEKQGELNIAEKGLISLEQKAITTSEEIKATEAKIVALREQWQTVNAETLVFSETENCCPTCKRDFDASDIEAKQAELTANFKAEQTAKKEKINIDGVWLKTDLAKLDGELETLQTRIEKGKNLIFDLKTECALLSRNVEDEKALIEKQKTSTETPVLQDVLNANSKYIELQKQLNEIKASFSNEINPIDTNVLIEQKNAIQAQIDVLNGNVRAQQQNESLTQRINELLLEEKTLAKQIAEVEKTLFTIERFNKLKIDNLEQSINEKFHNVKFKLFETQINGGEVECCDALINGVPFSDANNASKINAGLDIINTLCEFYQTTAPIFIDNRESVVKLIKTPSQVVNLIVSENHKVLTVA